MPLPTSLQLHSLSPPNLTMEKPRHGFLLLFTAAIFLSLAFFVLCIIAEAKKAKKEDVRLDGKLCYVPESDAFHFGIAALVCLIAAQIVGNLLTCGKFLPGDSRNGCKAKRTTMAIALLVLSWISFALALILLSSATSMSKRQSYGREWLDHKCYLVRNGVYSGSGILGLAATATTLGSTIFTIKKTRVERDRKIHAQFVLQINSN
ncbi:hypothetical protein K2173_009653 [Erythroxylum novogranatense]|uniref:Transmembrane protein n=1 Tax=Erythroxylum novogranatense TaxID=1862640 RepID=A0AAV8U4I9_9ROSI|nr:hypothetical protein K2173_009653 [Erythroxylum novogranatense]